jgi:hypothetical protein
MRDLDYKPVVSEYAVNRPEYVMTLVFWKRWPTSAEAAYSRRLRSES